MGFRIRKSINLGGGFRVNLSKTGIGYSWGVPGYRLTKTAKGNIRRTYSVPGTGLSYVEEDGKSKVRQNSQAGRYVEQETIMEDIESADIGSYQSVKHQRFIDSIKKILILNRLSTWLCFSFLLLLKPVFLIIGTLGAILKIYVRSWGKIRLDYEFNDDYLKRHNNMINAWTGLARSQALWQITQTGNVQNTKINAGASSLVNRKQAKIVNKVPFYIESNTNMLQLEIKDMTLIFMPDKILIINGLKLGVLSYEDIQIDTGTINFVELGVVPGDAKIVGYTWSKVNKDGSPDKRYKGNRELPVCEYGTIKIGSKSGLNIQMHCSDVSNTKKFGELLNGFSDLVPYVPMPPV